MTKPANRPLIEGEDFVFDEQGLMVFTRAYHLKRGYCCQSGCRHCPYGYAELVDPSYPAELQDPWNTQCEDYSEDDD
jgi:hypothetical protein